MDISLFIQQTKSALSSQGTFYFRAKISPGAGKNEITEVLDGEELTVKIKVAAPPEKGKANTTLCKFLGKEFGCQCEIVAGHTNSIKLLRFSAKNK